jgi:hypothetical protein
MRDDTPTPHDVERFFAMVERAGPHACWRYTGTHPFVASFGRVSMLAMAWRIGRWDSFPQGEIAYHRCGRDWCANPRHIGTASRSEAAREVARIRREGPSCRVESTPDRAAPVLTLAAPAKTPRALPPGVCSYCGCSGGEGTATVCGASIACPVCSAPEWPALVEAYGAESA